MESEPGARGPQLMEDDGGEGVNIVADCPL